MINPKRQIHVTIIFLLKLVKVSSSNGGVQLFNHLNLDNIIYKKQINIAEKGLRVFISKNKEKFLERVSKGPPESFRWLAWTVCAHLPIERKIEFYEETLYNQLPQEVDLQIKKDLSRTLSDIHQFANKTNLDKLYRVLKAFAINDKEVSYCQGMNFIVGYMLLISDFDEVETFYMMISLFSFTFGDNLGIRGFFIKGFPLLQLYNYQFNSIFQSFLPELHKIISECEIPNEAWIGKWFQSLFTISLPRELTARLWDCIFSYGLEFIFNFSIALLKSLESDLLKLDDIVDFAEYFKTLCPNSVTNEKAKINLDYEELIRSAKKIHIKKSVLYRLKVTFEKTNNINLSKLNLRYDLQKSFCSSRDSNSKEDEADFHIQAFDLQKAKSFEQNQKQSPSGKIDLVFINSVSPMVSSELNKIDQHFHSEKNILKTKKSKKNVKDILVDEKKNIFNTPKQKLEFDFNIDDNLGFEEDIDISLNVKNHNFMYNLENSLRIKKVKEASTPKKKLITGNNVKDSYNSSSNIPYITTSIIGNLTKIVDLKTQEKTLVLGKSPIKENKNCDS